MDLGLGIGIIGLIIGVAGLALAVFFFRRTKREKRLAYEILPAVPIAEVIAAHQSRALSIQYQKEGESPRHIDRAVIHFVRFTNFGKDPIRRQDLSPQDPLQIAVSGGDVLDISLVGVSRDVSNIQLQEASQGDQKASSTITFDFLDQKDGGLIQVVTDSHDSKLKMEGTVIGMPKGLMEAKRLRRIYGISDWGCLIPIIVQIAALVSVPFIYRQLTGSWQNAQLLALPVAALILPISLILLVEFIFSPQRQFKFPDPLSPPDWYDYRLYRYESSVPSRERPAHPQTSGNNGAT
ncbi:MAG: hypothetical protein IIA51_09365 [Chloroflexi bacterium]|nr:hypothetical protein [Chloroflexota bacterium]